MTDFDLSAEEIAHHRVRKEACQQVAMGLSKLIGSNGDNGAKDLAEGLAVLVAILEPRVD